MWPSSSPTNDTLLFPRRPRRCSANTSSSTRRGSATSLLEQRRRDLPPHSATTSNVWAFNGSSTGSVSFSSSSPTATAYSGLPSSSFLSEHHHSDSRGFQSGAKGWNQGVIGFSSSGGMLWNRPEREEEEREEEALPSYLSYLQAPVLTGDAAAITFPATASFAPAPSRLEAMEMQSTQLARALQDFIVAQMQVQGGTTNSSLSAGSCGCARRVAELENQMQKLLIGRKDYTAVSEGTGSNNNIGDRVSTLEGRQSAFQSQLAQISKVLGVPVGKHGKNSQLKTLVQTLHDEIEAKVQTAVAQVEAASVASTTQQTEELMAPVAATLSSSAPAGESSTPLNAMNLIGTKHLTANHDLTATSKLSFSTVLSALAEEHEASLTKLSTHFDDRLRLEGTQRSALECRLQARLEELDEWIQQVETELCGSRFEPPTPFSEIAVLTTQVNRLEAHVTDLNRVWQEHQLNVQNLFELPNRVEHQRELVAGCCKRMASVEATALSTREKMDGMTRTIQGLKVMIEKLMRDTGSAEELLQQYVSTITHQVASVTRQYVAIRIRDNNRLLDATLRARIPSYGANESERFLLVRPEA